ncbi:MAG: anti-sigma factor [Sphingomonadales bacterium]
MNPAQEPITERDLHAYADGGLACDLQRLEAVESYLAQNPDAAAFVAEIKAQNAAIAGYFSRSMAEPVPRRLIYILADRPRWRIGAMPLRAAAAMVALIVAVAGGWQLGQQSRGDGWAMQQFATIAADLHRQQTRPTQRDVALDDTNATQPLNMLSRRIGIALQAPEILAGDFNLVGKQQIGADDKAMVQLSYQRADGAAVNLFVRPRWGQAPGQLGKARDGDVTTIYWLDGPLAFAVTTSSPTVQTELLAREVQRGIGAATLTNGAETMALTPATATLTPH